MGGLITLLLGGGALYWFARQEPEPPKKSCSISTASWSKEDKAYYKREVDKMCRNDRDGFKICSEDFKRGIAMRKGYKSSC